MLVTAVGLNSQKGSIMKLLSAADEDQKEGTLITAPKHKSLEPEKKTSVLEAKLKKFAVKIGYIG